MAAGGITYLLVNPLNKVIYLLRCIYLESLETGADLLAELQAFPLSPPARGRAALYTRARMTEGYLGLYGDLLAAWRVVRRRAA